MYHQRLRYIWCTQREHVHESLSLFAWTYTHFRICIFLSREESPTILRLREHDLWFVISLVTWVHRELECPICLIHAPPLKYEGLIMPFKLLSSRKVLPFKSEAWKCISHCLVMSLHSSFFWNPKISYWRELVRWLT